MMLCHSCIYVAMVNGGFVKRVINIMHVYICYMLYIYIDIVALVIGCDLSAQLGACVAADFGKQHACRSLSLSLLPSSGEMQPFAHMLKEKLILLHVEFVQNVFYWTFATCAMQWCAHCAVLDIERADKRFLLGVLKMSLHHSGHNVGLSYGCCCCCCTVCKHIENHRGLSERWLCILLTCLVSFTGFSSSACGLLLLIHSYIDGYQICSSNAT